MIVCLDDHMTPAVPLLLYLFKRLIFKSHICYFYSNIDLSYLYAFLYSLVSPQGSVSVSPPGNILTAVNIKVTLTCIAQGGPNNMFKWRRQGVVISNDPVLSIPMVTGSDGGVYQCTVSNDAGSDTATTTIIGM